MTTTPSTSKRRVRLRVFFFRLLSSISSLVRGVRRAGTDSRSAEESTSDAVTVVPLLTVLRLRPETGFERKMTSLSSTSMTESLFRLLRLPVVPVLTSKIEEDDTTNLLSKFFLNYPEVLSMSERSRVRSRKTESGVLGMLVPPVPVPESPVASPLPLGLRIDSSSSSSSSFTASSFSSTGGLGDRSTTGVSLEETTSDWMKESSSVASCVIPVKYTIRNHSENIC